ncbi:MAG: hypothetical protein K2N65_05220, partial [Anaeroplasmataceae bacterium]|nr:hypothetical protein [Anaeroplasmataceae bacterium]
SLLIGKNPAWGKWKWLSSIAFGFSYMATDFFTMASYGIFSPHLNYSYYLFLPIGICISLFGLESGTLLYSFLEKRKNTAHPKPAVPIKSYELNLLCLFLPLLPLFVMLIFACVNLHLLSSHNWSVRFFTIAFFILYGWTMIIQLPYILYFFIKKKSLNFKKDFPILFSEIGSLLSLILLIVEYKIFDKWYQTSSNGTLPYPFYGVSYTLNIIVLCLLFMNFILTGIFIIKRIKKISLSK